MVHLGRWRMKQTLGIITLVSVVFILVAFLDIRNKYRANVDRRGLLSTKAAIFSIGGGKEPGPVTRTLSRIVQASKTFRNMVEGKISAPSIKESVNSLFTNIEPYKEQYCNNRIVVFNQVLMGFKNLTLNPSKSYAKATGMMDPTKVLRQSESDEEYHLSPGFFSLACPNNNQFHINSKVLANLGSAKHMKDYIKSLNITDSLEVNLDRTVDTRFTVALMRYEYANVYWTMMDLYDVYLIMRFFNATAQNTQILLTDARPQGHLDALWKVFGSVAMLQEVKTPVLFPNIAWRYSREYSPLLQRSSKTIPDISGFRTFILSRLGLSVPQKHACDRLTILYIWRRDYVAHPRNPSGVIGRKIRNEDELIHATKSAFPTFPVKGVQLDKLNITEQLRLVSQADVYVGMHGAAMTFSLFLQPGSAVIELYPFNYKVTNWHMEMAAKWSGHRYFEWHNKDAKLEEEKLKYTTIPTNIPIGFIKQAADHICRS